MILRKKERDKKQDISRILVLLAPFTFVKRDNIINTLEDETVNRSRWMVISTFRSRWMVIPTLDEKMLKYILYM